MKQSKLDFQGLILNQAADLERSTIDLQFVDESKQLVQFTLQGSNAMELLARLHEAADQLGVTLKRR